MTTATDEPQWYVLLFPSDEGQATLQTALAPLARATGGELNRTLHVTVGYFRGTVDPQLVVEHLRPLDNPRIPVRASGLFSFSEEPDPLFGWSLSLNVWRQQPILRWQRDVRTALSPLPLAPTFTWEEQRAHINVLHHLPVPPGHARALLGDHKIALSFTATRLVVSERTGDDFVNLLEQPLRR